MLFMPPLIQLLVFGFAVNLDVEHARIAWMDQDRTPESRELLARFRGLGPLRGGRDARERRRGAAAAGSRQGATCVVRVLPGFARDMQRGRTTVGAGAGRRHQFQYRVASSRAMPRRSSPVIRGDVMNEQNARQTGRRARRGPVHAAHSDLQLRKPRLVQSRSAAAATISCRAWW